MKTNSLLGFVGVAAMFALAFVLYWLPSIPTAAAITQTIIGYAVPNATTLGYGFPYLILPIAVCALFCGIAFGLNLGGEFGSLMLRLGLLIGSIVGMLGVTASAPTTISFAFPLVAAIYFITYIWKKT